MTSSENNGNMRDAFFNIRRLERSDKLQDDRTLENYGTYLRGFHGSLKYISEKGLTKRALDIGIGQGIALLDLYKLARLYGVTFEGTGLTKPVAFDSLPKEERPVFHRTTAEYLRKLEAGAYDLVVSVFGVAYANPDQAVQRIDDVLTSGGIFKGSFTVARLSGKHKHGMRAATEFMKLFAKRGYSVFSTELPENKDREKDTECAILVAVKPGRNGSPTAQEVYENDKGLLESYRNQDKTP